MNSKPKIDDVVKLIDDFMAKDGGHLNIIVDDSGKLKTEKKEIDPTSVDCAMYNQACKTPTLFEGLDIDEEE